MVSALPWEWGANSVEVSIVQRHYHSIAWCPFKMQWFLFFYWPTHARSGIGRPSSSFSNHIQLPSTCGPSHAFLLSCLQCCRKHRYALRCGFPGIYMAHDLEMSAWPLASYLT
eukprot:scaffold254772_cov32-Tisochrysis_lutea.AAC.2